MASMMISDRGLRKKLIQDPIEKASIEKASMKKASKRKSPGAAAKSKSHEQNNNQSKKPKYVQTGDSKADLLAAYQPWVIQTYGDLAKTKTITLRKYARILRTLRGEECNSSDSSKFRFWVKAKGFHLGKPPGYDAKPADGIDCRYSVLDVDDGPEAIERCSGSANDPALYIPAAPVKSSSNQDPIYRKVAIVENFFDIIYTVHVELEGRAGKHAGQKRTYRTITETYAFLPREAVTRFLMGCTDCQRRPRSLSPSSVLPTPSPSPTPLPSSIIPNGFHQLTSSTPIKTELNHKLKNGIIEISTKNWENEIDASQHSIKSYKEQIYDSPRTRSYVNEDFYSINSQSNGVDLSSKNLPNNFNGITNHLSPNIFVESSISAFKSVRKDLNSSYKEDSLDTSPIKEERNHKKHLNAIKSLKIENEELNKSPYTTRANKSIKQESDDTKIDTKLPEITRHKHKSKSYEKIPPKPYNPLDVCNLTSKDPPKSRSSPRRRHLNPMYSPNSVDSKPFPKPWSPSMTSMFSPHRLSTESSGSSHYMGHIMDMEIDYRVPITTTYLKHMRSLGFNHHDAGHYEHKETLNSDPSDIDRDDDQYTGIHMKDADKLKLMLLAWNIQTQNRGRNGEAMDGVSGETNMAELWASYHSALGLAGGRPPTRSLRDQPSPVLLGSSSADPGGNHDETSSSAGNGKEDDDALGSDDESDDRLDPQQHDPERLKAFNMFVRLFVDENLDRIVPISKQPKEKIQAIIDSCTRQFPEFAERARKRIRTYLKSCRRNKKVRGELPSGTSSTPAWDATIRPTPAHLTSVQAEQILAQACENESHNAKRMRLGLEPVSQPMPTSTPGISIDTTASSVPVSHSLLGLYNSSVAAAQLQGASPGLGIKGDPSNSLPSLLSASIQSSLENGICLNNNNISKGQGDINSGGKTVSSRTSTPSITGSLGDFSSSLVGGVTGPGSGLVGGALLSSLGGPQPNAMAAYQSALFSAMAAGAHHTQGLNFGGLGVSALTGNGPTDLSMKNASSLSQASFPSALSSTNAVAALGLSSSTGISHGSQSGKPLLLSHKLNTAEMAAVRQLITGYRESAAFLLRSADELETLLLQQP